MKHFLCAAAVAAGLAASQGSAQEASSYELAVSQGFESVAELAAALDLYEAVLNSDFALVESLIEKGTSVNVRFDNVTLLHVAAEMGSLPMAKLLIDKGADVNAKITDGDGRTPLHLVTGLSGNLPMAKLLIDKGADVNDKDEDGYTPLHFAVTEDNLPMAKLLIDSGANVNDKTENSGTAALHWAAIRNNLPMAKLLIDSGANVNDKITDGYTPLHFAARQMNGMLVDMLMQVGAVESASNNGLKPSEIWGCDAGYIEARPCDRDDDPCDMGGWQWILGWGGLLNNEWTHVIRVPFADAAFCERISSGWKVFYTAWLCEEKNNAPSECNAQQTNNAAKRAVLAAAKAEIQWQQAYRQCSVFEWATPNSVVRNDEQCQPELRARIRIETN